ncbi:MAG TPA: FAD-dependent oxidoreductase [Kofleriaceae bacterium]|nr:FAD-dependent oxidoreductase [Kofleriaceae bacterium]
MPTHDVVILGGGVSGLCFAFHAARAGRAVHLVEQDDRLGGCLDTRTSPDGFWIELGAHTCYNSYGAFLEVLEGVGLLGELQPRGKPVLRFLDGNTILPGKNLGGLLRRMSLWELARSVPRILGASQDGQTVRSYYGRIVGAGNYERVLGPMLSAVPSQRADDFPADMLFKKRPRRKDVLRSFTLQGGLGTLADRIRSQPGVTVATGSAATAIERDGAGFAVTLATGERVTAELVAIATPPRAAARLLSAVLPSVAPRLAALGEATVDSLGVVVRADKVPRIPYATFLIPRGDILHSVVTRDVVPDPTWRGFVFHFQPGHSQSQRFARAGELLDLQPADVAYAIERRTVLPSPVLGHRDVVAELDAALASERLAVTGNWFAGLAIEDCAIRSRAEWQRLAAHVTGLHAQDS